MAYFMVLLYRIDPLVGDDSVNYGRCYVTPATYTQVTIEELFSVRSIPNCYSREFWSLVSSVEFCTGGCEERT
jgi:hypothetical protein